MNILLTGGAGYIGSHAARRLTAMGHRVTILDDLSHGHRAALDPKARFYEVSIANREALDQILEVESIEAVMHFAAFIEVGESVSSPAKYYANNLCGGLALLDAVIDAGIRRFVFSSTAAVYGVPDYTPIDEAHPRHPINPYGHTKNMVELALGDYAAAYGLGYVALRYFNVAGAAIDASIGEAHEPETHLIPRILNVAAGKAEHAMIYGTDYPTPDGTAVRDYVHVEDLVEAHVLALAKAQPRGGGHAYNLGSESGFSVREVIDACRRVTGHPIPAMEMARRDGDPAVLVASSHKIRDELGWTLRYPDLDAIVRTAWNWHLKSPKGFGA